MTIPNRVTRCLALLGLLAAIGSCADNVAGPPRELHSPLVVSDAVPNAASRAASIAPSAGNAPMVLRAVATAAGEPNVAYISLAPGTYPSGVTAVIRNTHRDATVTAPMVDGGLDPIPVGASEGDTVEIDVLSATGTSLTTVRARVPAKRRPTVVRTVPPRGKTEVALNGRIIVVFSEPVDEATLSAASVQLFRGDHAVSGTVRLLQGVTATAVFEPSADLEANAEYRLVVTEGVRDLEGDALDSTVTVTFTTGATREGPVASLSLVPDAVTVRVGSQIQLILTARDAEGTVLVGRPIVWRTTDASVATVSTTGLVTAVAEGHAYIDAQVEGWFIAASIDVSNRAVPVATITLAADSASVTPGATLEVAVEARDVEGNLLKDRLIIWTSSNSSVATVAPSANDRGVVTGVADGVTRIVVTSEGKSDTTIVTVGPPPPIVGLFIFPDTATLLLRGTVRLRPLSRNAAGGRAPIVPSEVTWQSSNPAVASVDNTGLVSAVGAGLATIAGTWNGFTATARISVRQVTFETLEAGQYHTCGVTSSGTMHCWGANDFGQAGRPGLVGGLLLRPEILITSPVPVAEGFTFAAVSAGAWHTCGVDANSVAHCWGYGGTGALGNGTLDNSWRPLPVAGGRTFVAVDAGATHTCGLTAGGAVYCWGSNREGELGNGTSTRSPVPVAVVGGLTFRAVAVGEAHTCGLTAEGAAYCWGRNRSGQLGIGDTVSVSTTPRAVGGGHAFAMLVAGAGHTCGLTTGGAAYCWGWNFDGQLGNGVPLTPSPRPVAVTGGLSFEAISAGRSHTCAIEVSGVAYCWGQNLRGRLGIGTTTAGTFATPQRVLGDLAFTKVTAGAGHTCARAINSTWLCWGDNSSGALGIGTITETGVPVTVLGQP